MLSDGHASFFAGLSGLISGIFYSSDFTSFRNWRFPPRIRNFASKYLLPIFSSSPSSLPNNTQQQQQQQQANQRAFNPVNFLFFSFFFFFFFFSFFFFFFLFF